MLKSCVAILTVAAISCAHAAEMKPASAVLMQCEKLSAAYCDPQFGCRLDEGNKCFLDSAPPEIVNCTQSLIDSGAAVAAAQAALTATISTVKTVNWGVMQNTSIIVDTLKDSVNKYDQAVKVYNQSLIKYNGAVFLLQQYTDALEALQKTCSATIPPPPPTCPALIAAAQIKVAQQKATVSTVWIQVTLSKSMLDITLAPLNTAEDSVYAASTAAAARYAEISKAMAQALSAKDDAMTYWEQVEAACGPPPPSLITAPNEEEQEHGKNVKDIFNMLFN